MLFIRMWLARDIHTYIHICRYTLTSTGSWYVDIYKPALVVGLGLPALPSPKAPTAR